MTNTIKSKNYYKLLNNVVESWNNDISNYQKDGWEIENFEDMKDAFGDWDSEDLWEDVCYIDMKHQTNLCSDTYKELVCNETGEVISFRRFLLDVKKLLKY